MTFSDRIRLAAQNAGGWLMIFFGSLFVIANAMQGSVDYVALNCAFISTGATSLWLSAAGFRRTALAVISVGSGVVFFFAALWFRSGMENYLLVTMAASILLLDNPLTRVALAGFNAAAYSYVKLTPHLDLTMDASPPVRHALNILLFLLALAGFIEFFRVLNSDYLKGLEKTNDALATANRSKEKLFSVIAHDLRGPVGNLKSSLDMLENGSLDPEEFASLVGDLAADVDSSYACLENLLSWSATQLGGLQANPANISLRGAVDEAVKVCGFALSRKQISLAAEVPEEARVIADPHQLQAVLRNLLSNAAKFTPSGGKILVATEAESSQWKIKIADNGVGMPAEQAARLFDSSILAFTSGGNAESGLGLGLDICRDFVALNGGKIWAESSPSSGTTVTVVLRAAPSGRPTSEEDPTPSKSA